MKRSSLQAALNWGRKYLERFTVNNLQYTFFTLHSQSILYTEELSLNFVSFFTFRCCGDKERNENWKKRNFCCVASMYRSTKHEKSSERRKNPKESQNLCAALIKNLVLFNFCFVEAWWMHGNSTQTICI